MFKWLYGSSTFNENEEFLELRFRFFGFLVAFGIVSSSTTVQNSLAPKARLWFYMASRSSTAFLAKYPLHQFHAVLNAVLEQPPIEVHTEMEQMDFLAIRSGKHNEIG